MKKKRNPLKQMLACLRFLTNWAFLIPLVLWPKEQEGVNIFWFKNLELVKKKHNFAT
ncbi:MAG: hypothetical protein J6W75_10325 [Bacteroidaceae bacterium]|nr:hypothetical protein [Bacteroidaceae bacterium]